MDDDARDDSRGGFFWLERGRRQPPPEHRLHHLRRPRLHGFDIKATNIHTLSQGGARLEVRRFSYGTGHGFAFQISAAYWTMVRSLENFPELAIFKIALRAHSSPSV